MVILALSQALPVGSGSSRMESPTMKRLIALLLFLSLSAPAPTEAETAPTGRMPAPASLELARPPT